METTGNHFLLFHRLRQIIGNMPLKTPKYNHILLEITMSSTPLLQNKTKTQPAMKIDF